MFSSNYYRWERGRQGGSQGSGRHAWQWQPTTTAHDPNPPIPLEAGGGGGDQVLVAGAQTIVVEAIATTLNILIPAGGNSVVVDAIAPIIQLLIPAGGNEIVVEAPAATEQLLIPSGAQTIAVEAPAPTVNIQIPSGSNVVVVEAPVVSVALDIPAGDETIVVEAPVATLVADGGDVVLVAGGNTIDVAAPLAALVLPANTVPEPSGAGMLIPLRSRPRQLPTPIEEPTKPKRRRGRNLVFAVGTPEILLFAPSVVLSAPAPAQTIDVGSAVLAVLAPDVTVRDQFAERKVREREIVDLIAALEAMTNDEVGV